MKRNPTAEYYIIVKGVPIEKSNINCSRVMTGVSICNLAAFWSFKALNRVVCDVTARKPIVVIRAQDCQLKFAYISNPCYWTKIMVKDVIRRTQFKYHETTASWNFFILRIAIVPPELRTGLQLRATYSAHTGNGGGASLLSSYEDGKIANTITAPRESIMMTISKPFIFSLRIK